MKSLWWLYQRACWYASLAVSEARKPLVLLNETLLLLTFLAVRGYHVSFLQTAAAYVFLTIVAAIVGKVLVVTGVIRYNNDISNQENPQLMKILERLDEIERKL